MATPNPLNPSDTPSITLSVAVGTMNPSKLRSVQQALERACASDRTNDTTHEPPKVDIQGFSVDSRVQDQPMGDAETKQGAEHRARAAFEAFQNKYHKEPHFAVGLEGGLEWDVSKHDEMWCMAWMAIYGKRTHELLDLLASNDSGDYNPDGSFMWGLAKTASFALPMAIKELLRKGMELGDADDQVFGRVNGKQGSGTVGLLTDGLVDRSAYYEHAIILALIPWFRPDVYPTGHT